MTFAPESEAKSNPDNDREECNPHGSLPLSASEHLAGKVRPRKRLTADSVPLLL